MNWTFKAKNDGGIDSVRFDQLKTVSGVADYPIIQNKSLLSVPNTWLWCAFLPPILSSYISSAKMLIDIILLTTNAASCFKMLDVFPASVAFILFALLCQQRSTVDYVYFELCHVFVQVKSSGFPSLSACNLIYACLSYAPPISISYALVSLANGPHA